MTYNLYNTQLAASWAQRIQKEEKLLQQQAEQQALKELEAQKAASAAAKRQRRAASVASGSTSSHSSKKSILKERLARLESELADERATRREVEAELQLLKAASKPNTPTKK